MLTKWTPFANSGIARAAPQLPADDLFRDAERFFETALWNDAHTFAADLVETPEALVMHVDLPGHDPKAVEIQVEGELLTIRAQRDAAAGKAVFLRRERPFGVVARSFVLPRSVDASKCEASYDHGVLTLTLPKREEARPRSIPVKVLS